MKKHPFVTALGAVTAIALLGACGTTDAPDRSATATTPTDASDECAGVTTVTGPVEITDSFGRTIALDQPAERVAVLEWQQIEDVLTLCVTPVAVADPDGYAVWDTAEVLPDGVTDVGTRGEPNLDALYATDPDLIIIEAYTATDPIIGQLEARGVPVLATKGADAADPVQNMLDTFELIAEATGREERAATVVGEFEEHLADAKQAIAGTDVGAFVYFDGWVQGGNVAIRPFGQGSLMGELGEELGMTNAWTGEVDAAYGLGQTDIEGMTAVGDATFFYTSTETTDSAFVQDMEQNPIWRSLPAVTEGRAHAFPSGIWTFGGPRTAQQVLDAYVDLLTQ